MVEIAPLKLSKLMLHIANIAESKCADSNFFILSIGLIMWKICYIFADIFKL